MAKSQLKHDSLNELIEFFDTHDMGEYWDEMPEVHFDVNIKRRRHLVEIEEEIVPKLAEMAKSRNLSIELLINSWLKDKISDGLIKQA
jgi:hypothetical protein